MKSKLSTYLSNQDTPYTRTKVFIRTFVKIVIRSEGFKKQKSKENIHECARNLFSIKVVFYDLQ